MNFKDVCSIKEMEIVCENQVTKTKGAEKLSNKDKRLIKGHMKLMYYWLNHQFKDLDIQMIKKETK